MSVSSFPLLLSLFSSFSTNFVSSAKKITYAEFSTTSPNSYKWIPHKEEVEHDTEDEAILTSPYSIPKIFHRSHKYKTSELPLSLDSDSELKVLDLKRQKLITNLKSCTSKNPTYQTRYYTDIEVDQVLEELIEKVSEQPDFKKALLKLQTNEDLKSVFVLRSDWFRLAVIYLRGGWCPK
jgi:hypothetical protein